MFNRYIKSQTRDSTKLIIGIALFTAVVVYLFTRQIALSLLIGIVLGLVLTPLYLVLTFNVLIKGMARHKVNYSVTKTGGVSGNSRIYYCKLFHHTLNSVVSEFPLELKLNASAVNTLKRRGYHYVKTGPTTFFIFRGDQND